MDNFDSQVDRGHGDCWVPDSSYVNSETLVSRRKGPVVDDPDQSWLSGHLGFDQSASQISSRGSSGGVTAEVACSHEMAADVLAGLAVPSEIVLEKCVS